MSRNLEKMSHVEHIIRLVFTAAVVDLRNANNSAVDETSDREGRRGLRAASCTVGYSTKKKKYIYIHCIATHDTDVMVYKHVNEEAKRGTGVPRAFDRRTWPCGCGCMRRSKRKLKGRPCRTSGFVFHLPITPHPNRHGCDVATHAVVAYSCASLYTHHSSSEMPFGAVQ